MLDPTAITNYDATDEQLQEQLIFWMCVAGKTAKSMAPKVNQFVENLGYYSCSPAAFGVVAHLQDADLRRELEAVGMGKYALLTRGLKEAVKLDPRTCTLEDLERVPGIGPKTARCFLLHSRRGARVAGLDTHVMKYLRLIGVTDAKGTPSSAREYARLERIFLEQADFWEMTPAQFDLYIWNHYAR